MIGKKGDLDPLVNILIWVAVFVLLTFGLYKLINFLTKT